MPDKFSESEKKWKGNVINAIERDYSFKTVSGEDVDLLYYKE